MIRSPRAGPADARTAGGLHVLSIVCNGSEKPLRESSHDGREKRGADCSWHKVPGARNKRMQASTTVILYMNPAPRPLSRGYTKKSVPANHLHRERRPAHNALSLATSRQSPYQQHGLVVEAARCFHVCSRLNWLRFSSTLHVVCRPSLPQYSRDISGVSSKRLIRLVTIAHHVQERELQPGADGNCSN